MSAPDVGSVWRHYRTGHRYVVVGVAIHTDGDASLVIYHRADQPQDMAPLWARPLGEWEESCSHGEARTPRFVRIDARPAGGAS